LHTATAAPASCKKSLRFIVFSFDGVDMEGC